MSLPSDEIGFILILNVNSSTLLCVKSWHCRLFTANTAFIGSNQRKNDQYLKQQQNVLTLVLILCKLVIVPINQFYICRSTEHFKIGIESLWTTDKMTVVQNSYQEPLVLITTSSMFFLFLWQEVASLLQRGGMVIFCMYVKECFKAHIGNNFPTDYPVDKSVPYVTECLIITFKKVKFLLTLLQT